MDAVLSVASPVLFNNPVIVCLIIQDYYAMITSIYNKLIISGIKKTDSSVANWIFECFKSFAFLSCFDKPIRWILMINRGGFIPSGLDLNKFSVDWVCYSIEIIEIGMTEIYTVNYINMEAWSQPFCQMDSTK